VSGKRLCLACALVPVGLVGGTATLFAYLHGVEVQAAGPLQVAVTHLLAGENGLSAILLTLRALGGNLAELSLWGMILPSAILLVIFWAASHCRAWPPAGVSLTFAGLAVAAVIAAYFNLLSFGDDFQMWIETGLDRIIMPGILLGWTGVVAWAAGDRPLASTSADCVGAGDELVDLS
jgi:hypothetical protein